MITAGLAALLLLAMGSLAIAYGPWRGSDQLVPPVPPVVSPQPEMALTGDLSVRVWTPGGGKRGLKVGEDPFALPVRRGDQLHLHAQLNQEAYVYLVWVDGQGQVHSMYPWTDRRFAALPGEQVARTELHNPPRVDEGWPAEGPSGLETVLLLGRRTQLPAGVDVKQELGVLPPSPLRDPREWALRGFDLDQPIDVLQRGEHRGVGTEAVRIDDPLMQAIERLRRHFEVVRAVRFAYQGD